MDVVQYQYLNQHQNNKIDCIAYDMINESDMFSKYYTLEDVEEFEKYLNTQLAKVDIPNLSKEDKDYMLEMMLRMYSNPLVNKLAALGK